MGSKTGKGKREGKAKAMPPGTCPAECSGKWTSLLLLAIGILFIGNIYFLAWMGAISDELGFANEANGLCGEKARQLDGMLKESSRAAGECKANLSSAAYGLSACQASLGSYPTLTYRNADHNFSINYPAGWAYFEELKWANVNDTSVVYLMKQETGGFPPRIIIDADMNNRTLGEEVGKMLERYSNESSNPFINFRMNEQKAIVFNNIDAHLFSYEYNEADYPETLTRFHIMMKYGGYTYRIDAIVPKGKYQENVQVLDRMLSTLRFGAV